MNIPDSKLPRIVVIGGGFAGIEAIKGLKGKNFQIVLFDRQNYHTFQPLLYQVSTACLEPDSISFPLRDIFKGDNFHFRLAKVTSIDSDNKTVHTAVGNLSYDYLIIATGSKTNFFGNKRIKKYSMPMKTVPESLDIRSLIIENLEEAEVAQDINLRKSLMNFVVVGGGPTGVELAGALAEKKRTVLKEDYSDLNIDLMEINLVEGTDRVLEPMSKKASEKAKQFLEELGVKIHPHTFVTDYDGYLVKTNTGNDFKASTLIWAAGVKGNPIDGLEDNCIIERANRIKVNEFSQIQGYKDIFAIGDVSCMQSDDFPKGHPMMAQPAIQQGKRLAKNLIAIVKGKELKPFKYKDKGSMATIGRNKAVVDLPYWKFQGGFAWFVWMFVHLISLVGFRNKIVTFINWTYSYIRFDKGNGLIIRQFKRKNSTHKNVKIDNNVICNN